MVNPSAKNGKNGTQYAAKLLNVSQTTYSRYESGALDTPSQSLIKLTGYYSTSVDYPLGMSEKN